MIGWLTLIPWRWAAALALLVALAGLGAAARHYSAEATRWQAQTESARADTKRALEFMEMAKTKANAMEGIASAARSDARRLAADAADARDTAGRVRNAAAAYARAWADAASAGGSAPAGAASDLLPELLARCAARAAELADLADRARLAGLSCERAYVEVTR